MYRGYHGSIEVSVKDGILYGQILWIRDTITYEGQTLSELEDDFRGAVDDYLELCEREGVNPDAPCSGTFQVRVGASLHREAQIASYRLGVYLNEFVAESIRRRLQSNSATEVHHHHHYSDGPKMSRSTIHYEMPRTSKRWQKTFNITRH
jgi:predicted HicB family RNase H-like nuclease